MTEVATAPLDTVPSNGRQSKETSITVKNVDMTATMQEDVTGIAVGATQKYSIEKDIATSIKKEVDSRYGPTWHVVVGKNFGSYVTHETNHFIYFYIGPLAFLIWKS